MNMASLKGWMRKSLVIRMVFRIWCVNVGCIVVMLWWWRHVFWEMRGPWTSAAGVRRHRTRGRLAVYRRFKPKQQSIIIYWNKLRNAVQTLRFKNSFSNVIKKPTSEWDWALGLSEDTVLWGRTGRDPQTLMVIISGDLQVLHVVYKRCGLEVTLVISRLILLMLWMWLKI